MCSFSGYKIYPGHGRRYARTDGKVRPGAGGEEAVVVPGGRDEQERAMGRERVLGLRERPVRC